MCLKYKEITVLQLLEKSNPCEAHPIDRKLKNEKLPMKQQNEETKINSWGENIRNQHLLLA